MVFFISAALYYELAAACLLLHRLGRQSFGGVLYLRSLVLRACRRKSFAPQAWNATLRPSYAILRPYSSFPQPCTPSLQTEVFCSTCLECNLSASLLNPSAMFFFPASLASKPSKVFAFVCIQLPYTFTAPSQFCIRFLLLFAYLPSSVALRTPFFAGERN